MNSSYDLCALLIVNQSVSQSNGTKRFYI